jgi:hypothetical protein
MTCIIPLWKAFHYEAYKNSEYLQLMHMLIRESSNLYLFDLRIKYIGKYMSGVNKDLGIKQEKLQAFKMFTKQGKSNNQPA